MKQRELMFSPPGSRDLASHFPSPGSKEAQQMIVTSGRNCLELYSLSSQHTVSLRTCADYLLSKMGWYSSIVYLTWKPLVTNTRRLLFQLVPSMPDTDGTGFGLFATPNTPDGMPPKSEKALHKEMMEARPGRAKPANLRDQVSNMKMWPTPQSHDNRDRGNLSSGAVKRRAEKGKQIMLSQCVSETSGQLNPDWVETLMGYPVGFTNKDRQKSAREFLDELTDSNNSVTP